MSYLPGGDLIQFVTTSPKTAYAGFGFGKSHSKLEMVSWVTNTTGSYNLEMYSTDSLNISYIPETNSIYTLTGSQDLGNGMMQYTTTRPRDPTGDNPASKNMIISLGTAFQSSWVWQTTNGAWPLNYHSDVD